MTINLNENWIINKYNDCERFFADVPCSVYKTLMEYEKIEDVFYGENEHRYRRVCDSDFLFSKTFEADGDILNSTKIYLRFNGIDTISQISINGKVIGSTDNMHRIYEFDVTKFIKRGENQITVLIFSPNMYIKNMQKNRSLWGVGTTMAGYPHIRKAHFMFGWDWGRQLPDMGIWKDVELVCVKGSRIKDVYISQEHRENGKVNLFADIRTELMEGNSKARVTVTAPNGDILASGGEITLDKEIFVYEILIDSPMLWWVRGFGKQPLYTIKIDLYNDENIVDSFEQKIGLRTLTISQNIDDNGKEFCFVINGVKIFAMGANYIPQDQIVTRYTDKATQKLLQECYNANFNFIRVWGGGIYPLDSFYDFCDENGIIVWQDFMFACSAYILTPDFENTVRNEIADQVKRLRNRTCLGLWCGNNEIESMWEYWNIPEDKQAKADYLRLFEEIIPEMLNQFDYNHNTFYWPSSPSSGGGMKNSSDEKAGDMHYWDVWHSFKPFEDFLKTNYRFCSEYGFESLPSKKTLATVASEENGDFNLMSPVMENHQKCEQGTEKIMFYLAQNVRYPYSFEKLIYASQLVQAECIKMMVEYMRRNRGHCMGSAYWQVNDSNPVISWSSIDYYNRKKGLHYYAKRFYAPVLLSVNCANPKHPVFNLSVERRTAFEGTVIWRLRDNMGNILREEEFGINIAALTTANLFSPDLTGDLHTVKDKRTKLLEYELIENSSIISRETSLFVKPKHFEFKNPEISFEVEENSEEFILHFSVVAFAKSICLELENADCEFSDNWFDMMPQDKKSVIIKKSSLNKPLDINDIYSQLKIISCYY